MEKEVIFASGMNFKLASAQTKEKAPWVKAHVSVKVDEAIEMLKKYKKADGWVNIDVKLSKNGQKYYMQVNTWSKEKKNDRAEREQFIKDMSKPSSVKLETIEYPTDDVNPDDIPF